MRNFALLISERFHEVTPRVSMMTLGRNSDFEKTRIRSERLQQAGDAVSSEDEECVAQVSNSALSSGFESYFEHANCYCCGAEAHKARDCPQKAKMPSTTQEDPSKKEKGSASGRSARYPPRNKRCGQDGEECVCRCTGSNPGAREDVAVQVTVGRDAVLVLLDTRARSIWVDREWFEYHSGEWEVNRSAAQTADGTRMEVCGKGVIRFQL